MELEAEEVIEAFKRVEGSDSKDQAEEKKNKALTVLMKLVFHFLGALVTQGTFARAMRRGMKLEQFCTLSDMAYIVLCFENYADVWMKIADHARENPESKILKVKEIQDAKMSYGLLTEAKAQSRYLEIEDRVFELLGEASQIDSFDIQFQSFWAKNIGINSGTPNKSVGEGLDSDSDECERRAKRRKSQLSYFDKAVAV